MPAPPGETKTEGTEGSRRFPVVLVAIASAVIVLGVVVALVVTQVLDNDSPTAEPPPAGGAVGSPSASADAGASSSASSSPDRTVSPSASPEPPPDYQRLASKVNSGVLKLYATGCGSDGSRIGSAFLIGKDKAVASYASVTGAAELVVGTDDEWIPAAVTSADPSNGVVILGLSRPTDGHVFEIDESPVAEGDPVGAVGIAAEADSPELIESSVLATDDQVRIGDQEIDGVARVDAEDDLGISGAPALSADGAATGMIMTGPGLDDTMLVSGSAISEAVKGKEKLESGSCDYPTGPDQTVITIDADPAVEELFTTYFEAINTADYATARARSANDDGAARSRAEMAEGWRSTYDFDITIDDVSQDGTRAHVTFTSIFMPGIGTAPDQPEDTLTCARWDMDYGLTERDGELLIDTITAHGGGELWRKC